MGAGVRDIAPKEVLSAKIEEVSGTGDIAAIAAVSGKKIVVIGIYLTVGAAQSLQFFTGTDVTDADKKLTGAMTQLSNTWLKANYNPDGHFKTVAGEALTIDRGGSVSVNGWINYYLE